MDGKSNDNVIHSDACDLTRGGDACTCPKLDYSGPLTPTLIDALRDELAMSCPLESEDIGRLCDLAKVGLAQSTPPSGDREAVLEEALRKCETACEEGACFSSTSSTSPVALCSGSSFLRETPPAPPLSTRMPSHEHEA